MFETEPTTYEQQVQQALAAFGWQDAQQPTTVLNKAAQMWYYGLDAKKVSRACVDVPVMDVIKNDDC